MALLAAEGSLGSRAGCAASGAVAEGAPRGDRDLPEGTVGVVHPVTASPGTRSAAVISKVTDAMGWLTLCSPAWLGRQVRTVTAHQCGREVLGPSGTWLGACPDGIS